MPWFPQDGNDVIGLVELLRPWRGLQEAPGTVAGRVNAVQAFAAVTGRGALTVR